MCVGGWNRDYDPFGLAPHPVICAEALVVVVKIPVDSMMYSVLLLY